MSKPESLGGRPHGEDVRVQRDQSIRKKETDAHARKQFYCEDHGTFLFLPLA